MGWMGFIHAVFIAFSDGVFIPFFYPLFFPICDLGSSECFSNTATSHFGRDIDLSSTETNEGCLEHQSSFKNQHPKAQTSHSTLASWVSKSQRNERLHLPRSRNASTAWRRHALKWAACTDQQPPDSTSVGMEARKNVTHCTCPVPEASAGLLTA